MPQTDGLRARNGPDRFVRNAKRLALAWIPLVVLQTAAFAEDRQPEHGCLVRTDDVNARGVAEVSADCRWSIGHGPDCSSTQRPAVRCCWSAWPDRS